jgi:hypothetical protein
MQLDDTWVLAHVVPERQSAAITTSTTAAWVTITVPDPRRTGATGIAVSRRAQAAAAKAITTTDTGIRREHAGGIIIGVSIGGLILLVLLAWCCGSSRRRSRFSDTSSSSRSTSRPSHSPPPKSQGVPTPQYLPPPYRPPVVQVPPQPSSGYFPPSGLLQPVLGSFSTFRPPSRPPVVQGPLPSNLGHASTLQHTTPFGEKHAAVRPLTPPKVEPPAPVRTRPARREPQSTVQITDRAYEEATRKTTRQKGGREFVVDEEKPQRAIAWKGKKKKKKFNILPRPGINTMAEE